MPPSSPPDSVAAGVLRGSWGITVEPERADPGTSRNTWRVGGRFWLSHSDATEETAFRREARLLEALPVLLAERSACWCVPEVVRTVSGDSIVGTTDGVWRLSRHLAGEGLDMRDADTYPALARMLAELHAVQWSGLDGPAERISTLVEAYRAHSGREVSIENVRAAMAVYWLQNYIHWRRRQERVGGFEDVLARQPGRLLAIAEFVGAR